jgi:hypothetical protein
MQFYVSFSTYGTVTQLAPKPCANERRPKLTACNDIIWCSVFRCTTFESRDSYLFCCPPLPPGDCGFMNLRRRIYSGHCFLLFSSKSVIIPFTFKNSAGKEGARIAQWYSAGLRAG